jgi:hypothetical protein
LTKAILAGGSNREVAARFNLAISAIQRHRTGCLNAPRRQKDTGASSEGSGAGGSVRFDTIEGGERCQTCGISAGATDPPALLKRAERLLHRAEIIGERAASADDYRLQLSALDRVKSALELVMRAVGMLQPESGSTTIVDLRRQQVALLGELSIDELRTLATASGPLESATDNQTLSP